VSEGSVVKIDSDVVITGCYVVKIDVQIVKIRLNVLIVKFWKRKNKEFLETLKRKTQIEGFPR
jgi:hypothetical protein